MLKQIDFNKLKVFYYIYLNRSIIDAAKELNVTPSAVSQHLKKLEHEINVHLFTRMHKRIVPTSEAETLFNIIQPYFIDLETELKHFADGKKTPSGMLHIGAPVEFGIMRFPGIISGFRNRYPDVTFSLVLGSSEKLLKMVQNGELNFALADLFSSQRQYVGDLGMYHVEPIVDEEVILACSGTYFRHSLKGDVSLENILSAEFISYDHRNTALKGWFKHHFGKQSVKIHTVLTVDSIQAVRSAIRNDVGLGVITSNSIRQQILDGSIIPIRTARKEIINNISLIQLQDKIPNFTEKTFQSFLKQQLQQMHEI